MPTSQTMSPPLLAPEPQYHQTRTAMGTWSYVVHGARRRPDDPDVLLLHGMFIDSSLWRAQVAPLARLGRVVVLDMPGHGRSELPPPFDLPGHAEVLAAALPAMEIRRAVCVGWSWGGTVALHLALRRPGVVAALALLDAYAEAQTRWRKAKYRLLVAIGRRLGLSPWLVRTQIAPLMFSAESRRVNPGLVDELVRCATSLTKDAAVRAAIAATIEMPDILGRLGTVAVPTLVLCGAEDRSEPPALSAHIAAAIPGARLALVRGAGHAIPWESPEEVNGHLVPFVEALLT